MTDNWRHQAATLAAEGKSWRGIAAALNLPKSTVSDYLRRIAADAPIQTARMQFEYRPNPVEQRIVVPEAHSVHDNSRVLLISDMHIPYHHKKLIPFLKSLKDKYAPTRVICLGDELDKHALSFHDSDPDLDSAGKELEKSLPVIAELKDLFPVMDLVDSNHGSMIYRRAKHHGLPRRYIKSYNDVLEVDSGWQWHEDMTIELPNGQFVYICHGKTVEALRTSQMYGMNHICGHYHESFGLKYWSTPMQLLWGMNGGCLIDNKSLAFAYNKVNPKRPIIGTGLIINGIPVLEAMPL